MPVPNSVTELVQRYADNRTEYRQQAYKEARMRIDFVNPLFSALGWDIDNAQGLPEAYRQVVYEDAVKIDRTTKAPDYSFRLGGQRKFFLETKKVADNISLHRDPAYQLRRYASTVKLPVSILTSFEEMAVYDGIPVPDQKDSPSKARLALYKYTDYLDKWDELYARFSREAVDSGAFDRYAQEAVVLFRGYQTVDRAFLLTIEGWRESLAEALTQGNPSLSPRDLNRAVQTLIDRILFLRICEARGVEAQYTLQPAANGANIYGRLLELFHHADERYNSGLFHFKPEAGRGDYDTLTPHLKVADKPLKEIIASLYYPESPFEFSVMPADILGQVYEQFLGKVIRVDGGQALVEEKPEVRKAGGVFYTPTYIVDYIVRQTVERLVEGKTLKQAAGITVLDPACGSGSFLIGAYQFLLDWHVDEYVKDGPVKHAKGKNATLYQGPGGVWRLTTAERKRILRGCIYGVDIDAQAVEVTKLSLLLKMLEGESAQVVDSNLKLFKERALPDMDANIKCGNSLIGSDFYDNQDRALFDVETQLRINTFDWNTEFAAVMSIGGFSAVIGNPPYIRALHPVTEKPYYKNKFTSATGAYDIYILFMEQALNLAREHGIVSLITPNKYFVADYGKNIRYQLTGSSHLLEIADLGRCKSVFQDALISTAISTYAKGNPVADIALKILSDDTVKQITHVPADIVPLNRIVTKNGAIHVYQDAASQSIITKMVLNSQPLSQVAYVRTGVMGFDYWAMDKCISDNFTGRRIAANSYVGRYAFLWGKRVNLYKREVFEPRLSAECPVLNENTLAFFATPKVIVRGVAKRLTAMLDEEGTGVLVAVHGVIGKTYTNQFLLGLLNSTLFNWLHTIQFYSARIPEGSLRYPISFLSNLPTRAIDFDNPADKKQHDQLVSLVEQMLSLHRALPTQTDSAARTLTTRALAATDAKIDTLVYALYNLTPAEIDLVEGRTAQAETDA